MENQKRKAFIINFIYFVMIGGLIYFALKELFPMFFPFIFGLTVAIILTPLIQWLAKRLGIGQKLTAVIMLLLFYGLFLIILTFFGSRIFLLIEEQAGKLPAYYADEIEPQLAMLFDTIITSFPNYENNIVEIFQILQDTLQNGIMSLSASVIGIGASWIVGFPARLVQIIFMIISSFFFTLDFKPICEFLLRQFPEKRRGIIAEVTGSTKIVIIKILRVYALLMTLTFIQLYAGFTLLQIPMTFLLAVMVAIVDILPILGTGTILLPWGIVLCIIGRPYLGTGILVLYLVITVVRQILEPKIIGLQVGLPPIVTLICIFAGAQLIGILGIFLFPVAATVIKKMNDDGTIKVFR